MMGQVLPLFDKKKMVRAVEERLFQWKEKIKIYRHLYGQQHV